MPMLSEILNELRAIYDEHGDVPVVCVQDDGEGPGFVIHDDYSFDMAEMPRSDNDVTLEKVAAFYSWAAPDSDPEETPRHLKIVK